MKKTTKTTRATAEERRTAVNALGAIRNHINRLACSQYDLDRDDIRQIEDALMTLYGVVRDLDRKVATQGR